MKNAGKVQRPLEKFENATPIMDISSRQVMHREEWRLCLSHFQVKKKMTINRMLIRGFYIIYVFTNKAKEFRTGKGRKCYE